MKIGGRDFHGFSHHHKPCGSELAVITSDIFTA
jgi:hypothetical protein